MKNQVPTISFVIGTVLLAVTAMLTAPQMEAQSSGSRSTTSKSATTPAHAVDQLLNAVEDTIVPLAEAMPADKYNFAPSNGNFKGVRTFAEQVKHVAAVNYSLFGEGTSVKPVNMPNMNELKTKEQIVQALKDSIAFGHNAIATLTRDNAMERVHPVHGVDTRAGVMVYAVIHMKDHYGQMVEYARMNGIVPPASRPSPKK